MIQIVVFQDEQTEDDGTILRPYVAALASHDVSTQGVSARHAVRLLRDWVLATQDMNDLQVSTLDAVRVGVPVDPEEEIELVRLAHDSEVDGASMKAGEFAFVAKKTRAAAAGASTVLKPETLDAPGDPCAWDEALARLPKSTRDRLVIPAPVPVYPPAHESIVARFAGGSPMTLDLDMPAGWEVRAG